MTSSFVLLAVVFMGLAGLMGLATGISQFGKQPVITWAMMMYFFGILPLYVTAVAIKFYVTNRVNGRVIFPEKLSKPFLLMNLCMLLPLFALMEVLGWRLCSDAFSSGGSSIGAILVILAPFSLVFFMLRKFLGGSLGQLFSKKRRDGDTHE